MAVAAHTSVVRTVSLAAAAVAASVAIPFVVHLLPGGNSIGATLLPIFWAPLLAIIFFGPVPAVAAAVFAPALNHLLTGMPPVAVLPGLTVELAIFVAFLVLATRQPRLKRLPLLAPVAYVLARVASGALLMMLGVSDVAVGAVVAGLGTAMLGLLALFVINSAALLATRKGR